MLVRTNQRLVRHGAALFFMAVSTSGVEAQRSRPAERDSALLSELARGPHIGAPEEAVVGIEVANRSGDGAAEQVRRGAGVVIRCDGFVLAPASLFGRSISVAGAKEDAAEQTVTVVINPGTPREKRVAAKPPRFIPRDVQYAAFKMDGVHVPALHTLLSDSLKAGDALQALGVIWDPAAKSFRISPRVNGAAAATPTSRDDDPFPGEIGIGLDSAVPAGSVVLGPEGTAVGLITYVPAGGKADRFTSFSVLNRATNCVTPLAVPPSVAPIGDSDMVDVEGGPFILPPAIVKAQPDLAGVSVACVAPFKIDRTEVTNKQYLEFWLSLPESDRKRLGFQSSYFPASWSKTGAPFPATISDLPVIGVPMTGALAYARAHGKRLPTPYEWALAAFGKQGDRGVEWLRRYVDDRNQTWARVKDVHREYLQFHPELQQETYYSPSHFDLPWMAAQPALQSAAQWSKRMVVEAEEPLWQTWKNPLYLEPAGSRDFDVSPCGARDMLLNASELVQSYPGSPIGGRPLWMEVQFDRREPTQKDPWKARGLFALKPIDALPPLSRLYRRAFLSPPADELVSLSNMSEIVSMLAPLDGWSLRLTSQPDLVVSGLIPKRPQGPVILSFPGSDLYAERPRHYRDEIGLPIPLDHTDRSPSAGPQLYYIAPTGFRCVK